jgi:hypothetical protein
LALVSAIRSRIQIVGDHFSPPFWSAKNRVVIACAGSRKTTSIVEEALAVQEGRVLLTTYTNENVDQILSCIVRMTFDRVLIFPTGPMKAYLKTKDLAKAGDLAKFYVGVTRARYSVTFVF